jgi:hypothetical protein
VLGGLFLFAFASAAEAGITISGGGYKGTGDPESHYDLFAYLDPGSTLVKGSSIIGKDDFFTLNQLIGIKGGADYKVITHDKQQQWGAAFGKITYPHLVVSGVDYKRHAATDVTFFYEGSEAIKNKTHSPECH